MMLKPCKINLQIVTHNDCLYCTCKLWAFYIVAYHFLIQYDNSIRILI